MEKQEEVKGVHLSVKAAALVDPIMVMVVTKKGKITGIMHFMLSYKKHVSYFVPKWSSLGSHDNE